MAFFGVGSIFQDQNHNGIRLIKERFWGTILSTMNLGFMSMGVQMRSFFE